MMDLFRYDFGYAWPWNYGHLVAALAFGMLSALAWRYRWPRWTSLLVTALAIWAFAGFVIVQSDLRMNLPLELPTQQFLASEQGLVLDAGAGSGRSSLMVLLARPRSRVVALDLYAGYFGIPDNTPERLYANAAQAGVRDRIEAKTGDMREIPLTDQSVDAAVSAAAIDHLSREDVERSLAEIRRVLRPGGQFLIMVINPDAWIRFVYPFFSHHGYFGQRSNPERWRSYLTRAGFEILEQGTRPGTLYLLARKS